MISKKEIFYKVTDFQNLQNIGSNWIDLIKGYFPFGGWITTAAGYQIALWAIKVDWIPYWAIVLILGFKFYLMIFVKWWSGKKVIKIGLYKAQQQYNAKTEHLSPYELEHRRTLINIAKAVGAKSEYTEL